MRPRGAGAAGRRRRHRRGDRGHGAGHRGRRAAPIPASPLDLARRSGAEAGDAQAADLRSYLAVRGGFDVPTVLGSRSTDTLSGVGPPPMRAAIASRFAHRRRSSGRARQHCRRITAVRDRSGSRRSRPDPVTLRVTAGPRDDWFSSSADLAVGEWVVSPNSNRVGIRLDRPIGRPDRRTRPLCAATILGSCPARASTLGAVQVPPSGQPVLFLADHPVTGGYPVIAVVLTAMSTWPRRSRPGQRIRFEFRPANGPRRTDDSGGELDADTETAPPPVR